MQLKDFIGKTVISAATNRRFVLTEITAPYIRVWTEKPDRDGHYTCYSWEVHSQDPISEGKLVFEDASLTQPFIEAYEAYARTEDAYWENYGYWMYKS